jgi:hypothetical protein
VLAAAGSAGCAGASVWAQAVSTMASSITRMVKIFLCILGSPQKLAIDCGSLPGIPPAPKFVKFVA